MSRDLTKKVSNTPSDRFWLADYGQPHVEPHSPEMIRETDEVVDSLTLALSEHDSAKLWRVAERSHALSPNSWLHKVIDEYLSVWRPGQ